MEAQRFPQDYDGVVAGASVNYLTHGMAAGVWNAQTASVLSRPKVELLHRAVLSICDSLDGIGLLDDPRQCHFDPESLVCSGSEDSPTCLTRAQVDAVKKIYAGPTNPRTGTPIYPGLEFGSELEWPMRAPNPNAETYYKYVVHENPNWDWHSFDLDRDVTLADQKDHLTLDAVDPDVRRFAARGGKLILYHGWEDGALAPRNTLKYYETVAALMGKRADDFVRLFMVPRMGHGAGRGPDQFNMLAALERWIEAGIGPDRILAQHINKNYVDAERPLCPYPRVPRWKRSGSKNDAANFECALPAGRK